MKIKSGTIISLFLVLLAVNLVSAIPGIPHQFYGDVIVNGQAVPDNNIIVASVGGDSYATITQSGRYGFAPNIFYIEDPDGDRNGEVITFFIGGKNVGSMPFQNNGFTRLDISTTTTCGDGYCLGNETCTSCQNDCGICTDPPQINIISPENKVYDTQKIDLIVTSDQTILVWMYAFNSDDLVTFTPDIILTAQEGENNVTVVGINQNFQSGSGYVAFTVELPVEICGDGYCNAGIGETCSTCSIDCGACASGGGGGGGSSSTADTDTQPTNNLVNLDTEVQEEEEGDSELGSDEVQETENTKPLVSRITGGVIGFAKTEKGVALIFVLSIIALGIGVTIRTNKNKLKKEN